MKTKIAIVIVIVLIILFFFAWKKETIMIEVPKPDFDVFKAKPEKAIKTKAPGSREEKCRDIIEKLTRKAYPTTRPNWLVNPKTGRKLELDGYCADLRSAFEYNGVQHYKFPNNYHKTLEDFDNAVERDEYKVQTCEDYGVKLLVIPYTLKDEELEPFIIQYLKENKII